MRRQPEGFIQLFHVIVQANDFYLKFYCLLSEVDRTRQSHASGGFWWLSLSLPFLKTNGNEQLSYVSNVL